MFYKFYYLLILDLKSYIHFKNIRNNMHKNVSFVRHDNFQHYIYIYTCTNKMKSELFCIILQ